MSFFVYMLASRRNGTFYIGMADNLARRVWEHQTGVIEGFTKKYGVKTSVWYEVRDSRETAFLRERQTAFAGLSGLESDHKNRVGHISVRHIWADGELSKPSPSLGCLKLRPTMSTKSSRLTLAFGSNE